MNKMGLMAIAAAAIATGAASADFVTQNGGGGALNVNSPMFTSDIIISDALTITEVSISLNGLTHAWLGDVDVTLTHVETGTVLTIFQHVGGGTFGDSSDFGGTYGFDDDNLGNLWTEAAAKTGAQIAAPGAYFASNNTGAKTFFSIFDGQSSAGTWRLKVVDTFPSGDDGALQGWTLNIDGTPIPGPGALALLGLAGLAGRRRRS